MVNNLVSWSLFFLVFSLGHALQRRDFMMKPKGTVKTLKSIENGDVIDCVDYYQQPAFDNPVINNSKVHPSYIPQGLKTRKNSRKDLKQAWNKLGSCPEGTVPIRRGRKNRIFPKNTNDDQKGILEYAEAFQTGTFYGGSAYINLRSPRTDENEFSSSRVRVQSAAGAPNRNSLEAGWMVHPKKYGDDLTRLFLYFTNDNGKTACYDNDCKNFVLVSGAISLGCSFEGSQYGGPQYDIEFNIHQDKKPGKGHWWVVVNGNAVGYWPDTLFTTLSNGANEVSWGGEISNNKVDGIHSSTHMGNGHFPYEGLGKTSYFRQVSVIDAYHILVPASFSGLRITNKLCYDLNVQPQGTTYGTYFLYGGPGLSDSCYNP